MRSWRPWEWGKVELRHLLEGVAAERVDEATRAAKGHEPPPVIPGLDYTEQNPEWVLLYDHSKRGQISPRHLRRMRDIDLEYLAGASQTHPELPPDEAAKVLGNIARATRELNRRYACRTAVVVTLLAAVLSAAALFVG